MSNKNLPFMDSSLSFEDRVDDLVSRMTIEEKASQLLHESKAVERLGIPEYNWWNECLHGVARAGRATVFPQAIGLAATFDRELALEEATAISDEARAKYHESIRLNNREQYKGLTFWTPNINIFRDPRWGRGQETYGEDPYLTAEIGTHFVQGLQGNHEKYLKTAACAKHFAVHSGPESERHTFDAIANEKDLEETYFPAFKRLVKEGVETVMGAYNQTNGEVCCGSKTLLVDILRASWGFKGHIVSDCWAIQDFHQNHKVTSRPEESVALALNNGCDINCGCTYEFILMAHKEGLITEETITQSVKRAMMTRMKLGMFDPENNVPYSSISMDVVNSQKHINLSQTVAEKSFVLLKNRDNILPLNKDKIKKLYVVGPTAADVEALLGNYHGLSGRMSTLLEGIFDECDEGIQVDYRKGCFLAHEKSNPLDWAVFESDKVDVTIACMGLTQMVEGEEGDALSSNTAGDRLSLDLPKGQKDFLDKLVARKTPVVLVLTGGSPIDLTDYIDKLAAVLFVWYPGEMGGKAVANALFGKISPSGKLPITFPGSAEILPPFNDYSMNERTYKYMTQDPQFPFGFGLSYSNFKISEIIVSNKEINEGTNIDVSVDVTNEGPMDADEVIQLYLTKNIADEETPKSELVGFKRVTIKNGETKKVSMKILNEQFRIVCSDGQRLLKSGEVIITVGNSSPGDRARELGANFSIAKVNIK